MRKELKCPFCKERFTEKEELYDHITELHNSLLPEGFTPARYMFMKRNKGKTEGHCVICKKPTEWNDSSERYLIYCSNECKIRAGEIAKHNMKKKYGKEHLLDDAEYQRDVMMKNRTISGKYTWSDGTIFDYFGKYEEDLLRFEDIFLRLDSRSIEMPSSIIVEYEYDGKIHKYIPDQYIPEMNLIIEVKYGEDNTHHYAEREVARNNAKWSHIENNTSYNFIIIRDKKYAQFLELFILLKKYEYTKRVVVKYDSISLSDARNNVLSESENVFKVEDKIIDTNIVYYPIYLVMTSYDSLKGKGIQFITGNEYNHAGISFNSDLSNMLSFGSNGNNTGLIVEELDSPNFKNKVNRLGVYMILLTKHQYNSMLSFAKDLFNRKKELRYRHLRYIELLFSIKNRDINRSSYVCSEFVDAILKTGGIDVSKVSNDRVTPNDLTKNVDMLSNMIDLHIENTLVNFNINSIKKAVDKVRETFNGIRIANPKNQHFIDVDLLEESTSFENFEDLKHSIYLLSINNSDDSKSLAISLNNKFTNCVKFNTESFGLSQLCIYEMNLKEVRSISVYEKRLDSNQFYALMEAISKIANNSSNSYSSTKDISTFEYMMKAIGLYKNKSIQTIEELISVYSDKFMYEWVNDNKTIFTNLLEPVTNESDVYNNTPYSTMMIMDDAIMAEKISTSYKTRSVSPVNYNAIIEKLTRLFEIHEFEDLNRLDVKYFLNTFFDDMSQDTNLMPLFHKIGTHSFLEIHTTIYIDKERRVLDWQHISMVVKDKGELMLMTIFDNFDYCELNTIKIEQLKSPFFDKENTIYLNAIRECCHDLSIAGDVNVSLITEDLKCSISDIFEDSILSESYISKIPSCNASQYTLYDEKSVMESINDFGMCEPCDRYLLATNISNKMFELNICTQDIISVWARYCDNHNIPINRPDRPSIVKESFAHTTELMNILNEANFPIDMDNDGKIIIQKGINNRFGDRYQQSHKLLKIYDKNNNIEGIKRELLKLWYMNNMIENYILHPKDDLKGRIIYNIKKSDKEHLDNVRKHILNDFNKYLNVVLQDDNNFDFQLYYNKSEFNEDEYKLSSSNIKAIETILASIIKVI